MCTVRATSTPCGKCSVPRSDPSRRQRKPEGQCPPAFSLFRFPQDLGKSGVFPEIGSPLFFVNIRITAVFRENRGGLLRVEAPIAKLADRVAGVFVPAVIAIALVTFAVWLLLGREFG